MTTTIHTLFYWCNDVSPMRQFYSEVLGWEETFYQNDEKVGWLTYQVGSTQVVFMSASQPLPVQAEWAKQPGWTGGTAEISSLLVQTSPAELDQIVERAKAHGVPTRSLEPHQVNPAAHSHFMLDPMGNTIEVYCEK